MLTFHYKKENTYRSLITDSILTGPQQVPCTKCGKAPTVLQFSQMHQACFSCTSNVSFALDVSCCVVQSNAKSQWCHIHLWLPSEEHSHTYQVVPHCPTKFKF